MAGSLAGKTALVTGASRGIGKAIALELGRRGGSVLVHYGASRDGADAVVAAITAQGGRATAVQADISSVAAIQAMFEAVDAGLAAWETSGLDILVCNAGISLASTIHDTTPEAYRTLFDTNVQGAFFTIQEGVKRINDNGRIIAISSMCGLVAYPFTIVYGMAKAALNHLMLSLAQELGPRGISCNAVAPGGTETDFIKDYIAAPEVRAYLANQAAMKRIGQPEDIAALVAFLASPEGGWTTGQTIACSGGMHLG